MTEQRGREGTLTLDPGGRYLDADAVALEILGVSLSELLTSSPDRFAIRPTDTDEQTDFRAEWEGRGSRPIVGTAGLRRADGTLIRVAYAIEVIDGGFRAMLRPIEGSPEASTTAYGLGDLLTEWRAAERTLAELVPGTSDWERTRLEIELLREHYQQLFRAHAQPD